MISFFRRLRQKLLSNNQFSKYLLYAIGEIFLVVIGILIALQINNWNENRKERTREKMYLQSLKEDLKQSIKELDRVATKTGEITNSTIRLIEIALDSVYLIEPAVLDTLLLDTFGYTIAMTNEGTIKDIAGSGDLKVVRNDTLRRMIASWEASFKMIREREDLLKQDFLDNRRRLDEVIDVTGFYRNSRPLAEYDKKMEILDSPIYRNGFSNIVRSSSVLFELYNAKKKSLDTMLQLITYELEEL